MSPRCHCGHCLLTSSMGPAEPLVTVAVEPSPVNPEIQRKAPHGRQNGRGCHLKGAWRTQQRRPRRHFALDRRLLILTWRGSGSELGRYRRDTRMKAVIGSVIVAAAVFVAGQVPMQAA